MRDTLIVFNGFIHDLATGVWIAVLLMMYSISEKAKAITGFPQGAAFTSSLMAGLWKIALASVAVVLLTGVIRTINFRVYGWTGDVARGRTKILLIKHIVLALVFSFGLFMQFYLASKF